MTGILILTHGELAKGYVSALNLIYGEADKIDVLCLFHETSIDDYRHDVAQKISQLGKDDGVLVLCDIFGASPYNVTAQNYKDLKGKVNYRSVTGVNLPMVIEAVANRELMSLDDLSKHVQQVGRDGIKELFEVAGKEG